MIYDTLRPKLSFPIQLPKFLHKLGNLKLYYGQTFTLTFKTTFLVSKSSFITKSNFNCTYITPPSDGDQTRFLTTIQNSSVRGSIEPKKTFKPMVVIFQVAHYTMKFFFYIKHLLTCGFVTVDSTEKLCQPKCKASIAGHSIPSTFFCTSAVCLLISQNVNKKLI